MSQARPGALPWPLARWGKHRGLRRLADASEVTPMDARLVASIEQALAQR